MGENLLSLMFPIYNLEKLNPDFVQKNENLFINETIQQNMILFGEDNVCRTSLLFQACLTSTKTNRRAVYICKELKFVPKQFHNMPKHDDKSCDLINFNYLQTIDEILVYLYSLKTTMSVSSLPSIIVIDSLQSYVDPLMDEYEKLHKYKTLCVLLKSAVQYINKKTYCTSIISSVYLAKENRLLDVDSFAYIKNLIKDKSYKLVCKPNKKNTETHCTFTIENESIFLSDYKVLEPEFNIE